MKLVRLLVRVPPNQQGEICGFPDDVADAMIARGTAVEAFTERKTSRVRLEEPPPVVEEKKPEPEPEPEQPAAEETSEGAAEDKEEKQAKPGRRRKNYVTKG